MLKISTEQRRARLGVRHALAVSAADPVAAADHMVVLHATDPASIYLSVLARVCDTSVGHIESTMFDDRTLMRTLAMRRTLFVASNEMLPIVERSSSGEIARKERAALEKYLAVSNIADPREWLSAAFGEVLDALDGEDGRSARAITNMVPRLATRITLGSGAYTQVSGATSRVLGLMAVEGQIARGRTAGSWTGRQYDWHRRDQWLPLEADPPSIDEASTELVRRWFATFGPGTMTDVVWWTGWTKTKTAAAMKDVDLVDVELDDGGLGLVLADDTDPVEAPASWVSLLPALDPTAMGWKERSWYVGAHTAELFDRNGNIGPTIWADGRIIGVWSSRPDGSIAIALFEKLSSMHTSLLDEEIARLAAFLDGTVVKPSFPTPLQKKLASN